MDVKRLLIAAMLGATVTAIFPAMAEENNAEATLDYRQGVMSAVGGNISAAAAILMAGADFRDNLPEHARALATLTADIPSLFPEGSAHEDSDALAVIWENPEVFQERASDTREAARRFHQAVEDGESDAELMRHFRTLGQSCRACHDDFRD